MASVALSPSPKAMRFVIAHYFTHCHECRQQARVDCDCCSACSHSPVPSCPSDTVFTPWDGCRPHPHVPAEPAVLLYDREGLIVTRERCQVASCQLWRDVRYAADGRQAGMWLHPVREPAGGELLTAFVRRDAVIERQGALVREHVFGETA